MRVVSLFPAATEMVAALGGAGLLVGVSDQCDWPPAVRALPRVTRSSLDPALTAAGIDRAMARAQAGGSPSGSIDEELLRRLQPDLVIGQSLCEVCAIGGDAAATAMARLDSRPASLTLHAHTLEEVLRDIQRVADALDLSSEGDELVRGMRYRLRVVRNRTPIPPPRVLVLEWLDPPYVAGHWVPELVRIAGGEDVGNPPGARSVARPWEALAALSPDLVVIALCGFDLPRAHREFAGLRAPEAAPLFVRPPKFLDGNAYTSRPGPRLAEAAELLALLMRG